MDRNLKASSRRAFSRTPSPSSYPGLSAGRNLRPRFLDGKLAQDTAQDTTCVDEYWARMCDAASAEREECSTPRGHEAIMPMPTPFTEDVCAAPCAYEAAVPMPAPFVQSKFSLPTAWTRGRSPVAAPECFSRTPSPSPCGRSFGMNPTLAEDTDDRRPPWQRDEDSASNRRLQLSSLLTLNAASSQDGIGEEPCTPKDRVPPPPPPPPFAYGLPSRATMSGPPGNWGPVQQPRLPMMSPNSQTVTPPQQLFSPCGYRGNQKKGRARKVDATNSRTTMSPPVVVVSVGSVGHPLQCGPACKYNSKKKGCKDGANCDHCHLCEWKKQQ